MQDDFLDRPLRYLHNNRNRHLDELTEFLRVPSVSALSEHADDMVTAARWLQARLQAAGFAESRVDATPGHPIVYAATRADPDKPTVLIYGHYDVQPVDPEEAWISPPFAPAVREDAVYARGASDDKGQVLMQIMAAEAWLQTGDLPVNLIVLIEGEEEIGSPHLPDYIRARHGALAADVAVISDTPMFADEVPAICYGLRGLAALDIDVAGPAQDLHSGVFGGSVLNPAHALATVIASLHTADGRVAVDGFYDGVEPLTDRERDAFRSLPFDENAFLESTGSPALFGEPGYTTLERIWARPTLEVNGLWSGFTGEGRKTIIPAAAHAKITCRLVPRQDPAHVQESVARHLQAHCPPGVRLTVRLGEGDPGTLTPIDHPAVKWGERAIRRIYRKPPAFIRMGGSIPVVVTLAQELAIDTLLLGFALPTENFHAPNEHFHLKNFYRGAETLAVLWGLLGTGGKLSASPDS